MKCLNLDWFDNRHPWGTGIKLINTDWREQAYCLKFQREDAAATQEYYGVLPPNGYATPYVPPWGGRAIIIGDDSLQVAASQFQKVSSSVYMPTLRIGVAVRDAVFLCSQNDVYEWKSTPFWNCLYGDSNPSRYNQRPFAEAVKLSAMATFFQYPDVKDRRLGLYDGCPQAFGIADPDHPGGSHGMGLGDGLDRAYYTTSINDTWNGPTPVKIWNNWILNSVIYDKERNLFFLSQLKSYFTPETGQSTEMTDTRIRTFNGNQPYLQGDDPEQYYHHLHGHLVGVGALNLEAAL